MRVIGTVSGEGGPVIFGDATVLRHWEGVEDGTDYERACELLEPDGTEGGEIAVGSGQALIWELFGGGVAEIYWRPEGLDLVRCWLEEPDNEASPEILAKDPASSRIRLGEFEVVSGVLAILWAPESGNVIPEVTIPLGQVVKLSKGMSMDGTGLLIGFTSGRYECWHDEVENQHGMARRCHIRRLV